MLDDIKNDFLPFLIALIIFIGFIVFILKYVSVDDAETVKVILAAFIAWMGAIIGFYFGQKPVKEVTGRLATVTAEKEIVKSERLSDIEELEIAYNDKIRKLESRANELTRLIDQL